MLRFGNFVLDLDRACVRSGNEQLRLRPKSFEVLRYLAASGGRIVDKDEILGAVWGTVVVTDDSVTQCITEIRRALGDTAHTLIETVPRRGYRFAEPLLEEPRRITGFAKRPQIALNEGGEPDSATSPAIAVRPFENLGNDKRERFLSDGITEDLITELSRFSDLRVIARNSSFQYRGNDTDVRDIGRRLGARYVLQGSIRTSQSRIRVNAQLVDAVTGAQVWAERYDRGLEDVFAVQDELARTLAAVLAVRVTKAEAERVLIRPPHTWNAYALYLRAAEAFRSRARSRESVHQARRLVMDVLNADAEDARAYALLSKIEWWTYVEPLDANYVDPNVLERASHLARKAVQLAPQLPEAHAQLGWTLVFQNRHSTGLESFEHAFSLNRNLVDNRYALALAYAGQPQRTLEVIEAKINLDPFHPFDSFAFVGHAQFLLGEYKEATVRLAHYAARAPVVRILPLWLAAAHAHAGDLSSARAEAAQMLKLEPDFTIKRWAITAVYRRMDDAQLVFDGLRLAGLP